ncbi:MAG: TIGR04255 family protein [Chloroflexi bacterium]|nr:TIGR04255 family protein [Chloroflexota bacterium]
MGKLYAHAPIVEALCEFRFVPSQPWDWTVPGLVYDKVKADFPHKQQQNVLQVEMHAEADTVGQTVKGGMARMQFLRQDKRGLLQVGPDLLIVNQLKPYAHWAQFKEMVGRGLQVYRQVAEPKALARIGLRYINRIEIPLSEVQIEEYMVAVPHIPATVPQVFASWIVRVEIPFEQSNGLLALQSGQIGQDGKGLAFLLDLDFMTLNAEAVMLDSALQWVETAHDNLERTFEACITDTTRRLFGEQL